MPKVQFHDRCPQLHWVFTKFLETSLNYKYCSFLYNVITLIVHYIGHRQKYCGCDVIKSRYIYLFCLLFHLHQSIVIFRVYTVLTKNPSSVSPISFPLFVRRQAMIYLDESTGQFSSAACRCAKASWSEASGPLLMGEPLTEIAR